jgi:hypothetical protein
MLLSDYNKRTPEQQLQDLNQAWDRIKAMETSAGRQDKTISALVKQLKRERIKSHILMVLVTSALASAFFALLKVLLGLSH